jgi:NAD(P)-dependent dehydrogenase (short-subunit alcohol dehydrogenase family)
MKRTAIVTGANRGIGYEVSRQLADQGYRVIMTSRDRVKGQAAYFALRNTKRDLVYHPLDVTSDESVATLKATLQREVGTVEVLVNNAAILIDEEQKLLSEALSVLRTTFETNYFGALRMCQAFIPLMKESNYGRVVNVSSEVGSLADMASYAPAYSTSKAALNALTRIIAAEVSSFNIKVNSVCPGWVRTDMGGEDATRSVEKGAESIIWLATLPNDGPTGGFFQDFQPLRW